MTPIELDLESIVIEDLTTHNISLTTEAVLTPNSTQSTLLTRPIHAPKGITDITIFWVTYNAFIMVCILAGNALTILAIVSCRRLRSLISNLFILSLAISDFAVGISLPYHSAFYLGFNLGTSENLCLLRFFIMIFTCCVSILTLIAIAVDRYIAILYALHYRRYMTRRVCLIIITFNWLTGAIVALVPVFINHFSTAIECEFYEVLPWWYMAGLITPGFVLIWLVMLMIYGRIMREATKQSKQTHCNRGTQCRLHNLLPDWKSMQVVIIIMGCFSICWLTYVIVVCMEILNIYNKSTIVYKVAFSLAVSNSAMNPVIYCWKNATFRRAYCRLLCCKNPNYHNPNKIDFLVYSNKHSIQNSPPRSWTIPISVIPLPMVEAAVRRNEKFINEKVGY
ncbi:histamine H2 receptor [Eurosta solidaginis]|uniref:histamine H2 receptor n=1 Tax=Eurosta solidaginis TaxID=178769 RepID=UPI00353113AB